jgi:hypothetical protein
VAFQKKFAEALAGQGTPEELAEMIWNSARRGEAWAILKLSERFEWQKAEETDAQKIQIQVSYIDRQLNVASNSDSATLSPSRPIAAIEAPEE